MVPFSAKLNTPNVLTAVKIFGFLISVLKGRTSDVVPPFESGPEATGLAAISRNPALAPQTSASKVSGAYNHDFKHSVASMKSSPHRRSGRR
jgi:hypothetical protein